jgi:hypothetical protein
MSISLIRAQNPQGVVTDGYILSLKAKELDELIGVQVRALRQLDGTWQGRAANAARNRAYRDIQRQHLLHEVMAAFASAMQSGGAQLVKIREVLLAWVDAAAAMFDVSDAGVVTTRPPNNTAPWVAIAATFTKIIQQLIDAFHTADGQLANSLRSITSGHVPGNDPAPGAIDPDSLNNPQLTWLQGLAGSGDPFDGEDGVGVPNTDLSIMGMTPDGRVFTIQGDTSAGIRPGGGPEGKRLPDEEGGRNNIIFWKMDEHGKWVPDEVVKAPFQTDGASTIPTSTFNVGDTMYASVMDVDNWRDNTWQTRSSQLWSPPTVAGHGPGRGRSGRTPAPATTNRFRCRASRRATTVTCTCTAPRTAARTTVCTWREYRRTRSRTRRSTSTGTAPPSTSIRTRTPAPRWSPPLRDTAGSANRACTSTRTRRC